MNASSFLRGVGSLALTAIVIASGFALAAPSLAANWCDRLSLAEVSTAVGKSAVASTALSLGKDSGACTYFSDAAKSIPVAGTQIYTKQGALKYKLYCETDKPPVKPGTPIKDLGDQACLREDNALIVRKGERVILITVAVMGANRDRMYALGKAALARL
jgi:hypothetical protein